MKHVALVVDDVEINRDILTDMLDDDYKVIEASDGEQALDVIVSRESEIALILLDLVMPKKDGFQVLEYLNERGLTEKIPVLIISGESAPEIEERCLLLGAMDFVKKPFNPTLVRHRAKNAEMMFTFRDRLMDKVSEQTAELKKQAEQLSIQNAMLRKMNERTTELLSNVIEARSLESGSHVRRVKEFTRILATELSIWEPRYGLTKEKIDTIVLASAMHDVGKIMIPDAVLNKPGKLTPEEFELMKQHTILGCEVLDKSRGILEEQSFEECKKICRSHHEKWDGKGYPDGLRGDEIPLSAQIVSIADCFDALTTERVYKKAFAPDKAYEMIRYGQCGAFNPVLIDCLQECRQAFWDYAARSAVE